MIQRPRISGRVVLVAATYLLLFPGLAGAQNAPTDPDLVELVRA